MTARNRLLGRCLTAGVIAAVVWSADVGDARADSVIKRPGSRVDYVVELDPHFVAALDGPYWADEGLGLGFRASIPFLDEPIKTINNNMAISFGFDWAHHGDDNGCWYWRRDLVGPYDDNCDANSFYFPVVLQWNFWLTDIISVYGEPGIVIRHWNYDYPCGYWNDWDREGVCRFDDTDVLPVAFYGGARFLFSERVGLNVRMGFWPTMLNIGASFML